MIFNNSLLTPVDTTWFQVSPVLMDYKFKSLGNGKIILEYQPALRTISKVHVSREPLSLKLDFTDTSQPDFKVIVPMKDSSETAVPDSLVHDSSELTVHKAQVIPQAERGRLINNTKHDWMVAISIFVLILMAVIRFSFSKYLHRVIDSIFNYQTSSNLFLEKNLRNLRGSVFLNLLFFLNTSFFTVQCYDNLVLSKEFPTSFLLFLYALAGLITIYLGKIIVVRSIGYIFNGINESKEYLYSVFLYNKNLGVVLLIVTLSVPFVKAGASVILLHAGLLIAFLFYLLRLTRGIKILFRKHVSIYYMILYLCALEILPFLVIYKLLKSLV